MLFCSQAFLVFFLVVFFAYWSMPWPRGRVLLLLVASFYFYASWNHWLAGLICLTTVMDYLIARAMDATASCRARRLLLITSLVANVGLLIYFKYANFFLQSLEDGLRAAGATTSFPVLSIILPVGISFYTFEAINYTVDVYRRRIPAEKNLLNFMLFILFFPHLIAGPIVRARDFLPQIARPKHWDWARLNLGAQFFVMGLFKKIAIADRMATIADPVFADPTRYHTGALWLGTLAWALQVYCDFSGYTDMALGAAHMLGYKLARNFNLPYLAVNIADFWRRWHISLSTWLRDYLFIPLGGSRGTGWQTGRNLLVTMTLGGLWHGANWTFLIWGLLHGGLLIVHRGFRNWCERQDTLERLLEGALGTAARIGLTFFVVCCTWVFFRAATLSTAGDMLHGMFLPRSGVGAPKDWMWFCVLVVIVAHVLAHKRWWMRLAERLPSPVRGIGYAAVLTVALIMAPQAHQTFIYFQF